MEGKIEVRCRSGYKGDEYPVGFTLEGQEYEVREILESTIEEDSETRARRRVFVVETDEGVRFRLVQRDNGWHCSKGAYGLDESSPYGRSRPYRRRRKG